jgi:hypothetical protein
MSEGETYKTLIRVIYILFPHTHNVGKDGLYNEYIFHNREKVLKIVYKDENTFRQESHFVRTTLKSKVMS